MDVHTVVHLQTMYSRCTAADVHTWLILCCHWQGTERVTDAQEWLQQLAASAQILFADEMKYILMSRLDKIEELEAEFAAEGASHDAAEAESDGEADTKPDTEPAAAAAHVHKDPAPSTKHVDSTKSHASEMSAGASTNGQQGEQSTMHSGMSSI